MKLTPIDAYGKNEVQALLESIDRKLDTIIESLASPVRAPAPDEPPSRAMRLAFGVNEAATMVGVSPWTLRRWIADGRLSVVRMGKRVLIPADVLKRLASGELGPPR